MPMQVKLRVDECPWDWEYVLFVILFRFDTKCRAVGFPTTQVLVQ